MRHFFSRFIDEYISVNCRRNSKVIIGLVAAFILGVIFGFFFGGKGYYTDIIFNDSINFTVIILSNQMAVGTIVLKGIVICLQCFAVVFVFSLTVYLLPLHFVFISYRGYIMGAAVVVFTRALGLSGFATVMLLVVPQQLIMLTALCLYISYSRYYTVCFNRYRCFNGINIQIKACIVFFLLSLLNIAVQLVLIYVIIKPFNLLI